MPKIAVFLVFLAFFVQVGLKDGNDVEINFYDMLGQKVSTVTRNYFTAGNHTIAYGLKNFAPGVYVSKIKTKNTTSSKTIIIK